VEHCGRGLGKHGLHKQKVPEGAQSGIRGRKKVGVMVGSGSIYGVPKVVNPRLEWLTCRSMAKWQE